ncbi:MAG: arginine--tRNA ligase [Thermoplasmata archaeon]
MTYPILEFKEEIKQEISRIIEISEDKIDIERPPKEKGDFAFPCYPLSPILQDDPENIADELSSEIELERGEVRRSGPYLNFSIDEEYIAKETIKACIEKEDDYGALPRKEEKMIVEHTSANPNGPLHVGRARNPIIGDTLARIYDKVGYDVEREYYVNDIGRQMAILSWGLKNLEEDQLSLPQRDKVDHKMVRYYQQASRLLEKDEELEEEIRNIIRDMEKGDEEVFSSLKENAEEVLSGITTSLKRLNIHFDNFRNESTLIEDGSVKKAIERISKLEETGDEDGALYFESDDDKIFITREDGTNLYPARDVAYHLSKAERAERLIDILGEDHKAHGEFIRAVLSSLGIDPPEIVFYSFVTFEGGEMSTRKGSYVTLDEFMDTAEEKADKEILKRRDDLSEETVREISKKVGLSAVRYNIIRVQPKKPIDFRWEEALNFQGDSAPFIQYSYTRARSILEKADSRIETDDLKIKRQDLEDGELRLLKKIAELPLSFHEASGNNAPHRIAEYAHELAAEFNQFYRDYPVLDSDKKELRLSMVKSFSCAMSSVLDSLGMEKPKKM